MLKNLLCALALIAAVAPGAATARPRLPTAAEISRIEAQVVLPSGSRPIHDYDRYYARSEVDGRPVIVAIYQRTWVRDVAERHRKDDPTNWKMATPVRLGEIVRVDAAALPAAMIDGGCSQIQVHYDLQSQAITGAFCNGAAEPSA